MKKSIKTKKLAETATVNYRGTIYTLTNKTLNEFKSLMPKLSSEEIPVWLEKNQDKTLKNQDKTLTTSGKKVKVIKDI